MIFVFSFVRHGSDPRRLVIAAVGAFLIFVATPAPAAPPPPTMHAPTSRPFGTLPDGTEAQLYTLEVPGGWRATITDYGAILTSLHRAPAGRAAGMPSTWCSASTRSTAT